MNLAVTQVARNEDGYPAKIEITLFDYNGASIFTAWLPKHIAKRLLVDFNEVKAGTRVVLIPTKLLTSLGIDISP